MAFSDVNIFRLTGGKEKKEEMESIKEERGRSEEGKEGRNK